MCTTSWSFNVCMSKWTTLERSALWRESELTGTEASFSHCLSWFFMLLMFTRAFSITELGIEGLFPVTHTHAQTHSTEHQQITRPVHSLSSEGGGFWAISREREPSSLKQVIAWPPSSHLSPNKHRQHQTRIKSTALLTFGVCASQSDSWRGTAVCKPPTALRPTHA